MVVFLIRNLVVLVLVPEAKQLYIRNFWSVLKEKSKEMWTIYEKDNYRYTT